KVVGNRLADSAGRLLMLRGANRSGTEYACIQGWGIFDGPSDDASVQAMASWRLNYVRVPLNEDCWLGIDGVDPAYGGSSYRTAGSQQLVTAIRNAGATQPIAVPGIDYANDLSQWLAYEPTDPLSSLVAEAHVYGNNSCGAQSAGACLTNTIAPVAAVVPVV